jgi:hypothetical protein
MSTSAIIEYEQDRITTHRHREITEAQKRPLKKFMEHLKSFILTDLKFTSAVTHWAITDSFTVSLSNPAFTITIRA